MQGNALLVVSFGIAVVSLVFWFLTASKFRKFRVKYEPILNVEAEVAKVAKEKDRIQNQIVDLKNSYLQKKAIFDQLLRQVALYEEELEMIDFGFYRPHFDFDASEKYKKAIEECKAQQKQMTKNKEAVYCRTEWSVDGSKAKGRTMANRSIRLTSRAFNNECDAIIARVRWNNAVKMEERIRRSAEAIDKMNASNNIFIADRYVELKIQELRLTHEWKEKKQREKEEAAAIREQMREEAKLQKEIDNAAREEEKYQKLLDKAQKEAESAAGAKLEKLQAKIAMLQQDLEVAQENNQRAISMAQQTKRGHVYIISNIGSFGKQVFKIGMTRRLDPQERVNELGDASVPFKFDVHAMIKSEDAPALENSLHKAFEERRLNLVNLRREFFNVTLSEIKDEVLKQDMDVDFIETAEAREYRESEMIRSQNRQKQDAQAESVVNALPDAI